MPRKEIFFHFTGANWSEDLLKFWISQKSKQKTAYKNRAAVAQNAETSKTFGTHAPAGRPKRVSGLHFSIGTIRIFSATITLSSL